MWMISTQPSFSCMRSPGLYHDDQVAWRSLDDDDDDTVNTKPLFGCFPPTCAVPSYSKGMVRNNNKNATAAAAASSISIKAEVPNTTRPASDDARSRGFSGGGGGGGASSSSGSFKRRVVCQHCHQMKVGRPVNCT